MHPVSERVKISNIIFIIKNLLTGLHDEMPNGVILGFINGSPS